MTMRIVPGCLGILALAAIAAPAAAQTGSPMTDMNDPLYQGGSGSVSGGMGDMPSSCAPTEAEKEEARRELEPEYAQRVQSNGQASAEAWLNEQVMALFERQCPDQ